MPLAVVVAIVLAGGAALVPALARRRARRDEAPSDYVRDPARDARAELRARELLRSTAGDQVADSYEQLGFVGVESADGGYAYVVYPHRPIVAYDTGSGELLSEYCVRFPDRAFDDRSAGEWLPDADDVLAKWMALRADEQRLIGEANMNLPGKQLDPEMVRRDVGTLREWERAR